MTTLENEIIDQVKQSITKVYCNVPAMFQPSKENYDTTEKDFYFHLYKAEFTQGGKTAIVYKCLPFSILNLELSNERYFAVINEFKYVEVKEEQLKKYNLDFIKLR